MFGVCVFDPTYPLLHLKIAKFANSTYIMACFLYLWEILFLLNSKHLPPNAHQESRLGPQSQSADMRAESRHHRHEHNSSLRHDVAHPHTIPPLMILRALGFTTSDVTACVSSVVRHGARRI